MKLNFYFWVGSDDLLHGPVPGEVSQSTKWSPADVAGHEAALKIAITTDEMSDGALKHLLGRPHYLETNGTLKLLVQGARPL